jgi:SAM-dependent methyltransferase
MKKEKMKLEPTLANMMCHEVPSGETWDNKVRIDVGCGLKKRPGYIGLDKDEICKPDIIHNIEYGAIPIEDSVVDIIYTSHTLEHLEPAGYINAMNQFWRILRTGGTIEIVVPYFRTKVAVQDPGHRMQFCEDSFKYLDLTSNPHQHYTIEGFKCNFGIVENEIRGKDFEHLMLHVTLVKKEMPLTEVDGFGMHTDKDHTRGHFHVGEQEEFMNTSLGIQHEFIELIEKYPELFNVAAECAQLRDVHAKVAFNVLGEDGFIQEVLNVQRKMIRVYGMALSGEGTVEIWKLRKNMFDLVNYSIAALETLDKEIEKGKVALTNMVPVNGNLNHMIEAAIRDSGGYPEGTVINPKLLSTR